jgi:putative transposase
MMKMDSRYLSDEEWLRIAHLFNRSDPRGHPGIYEKRDIVEGILYTIERGIAWRKMPSDFPPWYTVYDHFRRWKKRGVWEQVSHYRSS